MFNESKYTTWYYAIINSAKEQPRKRYRCTKHPEYVYYEQHHILPKSMGGDNKKENLVLLTPREHFICHLLLTKMCVNPKDKKKMAYALFKTTDKGSPSKHMGQRYTSKLYEILRKEAIRNISGENCYMFGVQKSEEQKIKIQKTRQEKGLNLPEANPMFGRNHSAESIAKMSQTKKERNKGNKEKFIGANPLSTQVTDGVNVYPSINEAARSLNVHKRVIKRKLASGEMVYAWS